MNNMKTYKEILSVQCMENTAPMSAHIVSVLDSIPNVSHYFDESGNLFVTRGEGIKPMIVAHMDTVQKPNRNKQFRTRKGKIYGILNKKQTGIGADDKNGIYIALEALKMTSIPLTLLFTHGEESGCIGASEVKAIDMDNVAYMIQYDRKGAGDIIEYCSKEFTNALIDVIGRYGYRPASGLFTDVSTLSRRHEISAVNLSCGYYGHHTPSEFTVISELENALQSCIAILEGIEVVRWKYEHIDPVYDYNNYEYGSDWNAYNPSQQIFRDSYNKWDMCEYCGEWALNCSKDDPVIGCICPKCAHEYHVELGMSDERWY